VNLQTNREISIIRRRGFGQYALNEFPDDSLSIFCHRGDSSGEGGSGVRYLDNIKIKHPPLSMLLML